MNTQQPKQKKSYAQVIKEARDRKEAELNGLKTELHNMRANFELCLECQAEAATEIAALKAINNELLAALQHIAALPRHDEAHSLAGLNVAVDTARSAINKLLATGLRKAFQGLSDTSRKTAKGVQP